MGGATAKGSPAGRLHLPGRTDRLARGGNPYRRGLRGGAESRCTISVTPCSVDDCGPETAGSGVPALKVSMTGPEAASGVETWLAASPMESNIGSGTIRVLSRGSGNAGRGFSPSAGGRLGPGRRARDSLRRQGSRAARREGKHRQENRAYSRGRNGRADRRVFAQCRSAIGRAEVSQGRRRRNPLLELRIYLPKKKEPQRQMVFAKHPCLNLDGINGRVFPVKFWYHHPAVKVEPGVEFFAVPSGKLYCRIGGKGKWRPRGRSRRATAFPPGPARRSGWWSTCPHARQEVRYLPVLPDAAGADSAPAAALLEVAAGGASTALWLQQGEPGQMPHPLKTAKACSTSASASTRSAGLRAAIEEIQSSTQSRRHGRRRLRQRRAGPRRRGKSRPRTGNLHRINPWSAASTHVCQSAFLPGNRKARYSW